MALAYQEEHGSPQEHWDPYGQGITATRTLRCPWDNRYTVAQQLLFGASRLYEHHGLGTIVMARSVAIAPAPGQQASAAGTVTAYNDALLTVEYGVPSIEQDPETGELFTESIEPAGQFIQQDHELFYWKEGDDKVDLRPDEAPGKPFLTYDYVVTRFGLRSVPPVDGLVDHVNDGVVTARILGRSWAAETLLFNPAQQERRTTTDFTTPGWTVIVRLSFNPHTWNKVWRAATGEYESMYVKETDAAHHNFPLADFGVIWL